MITWHREEFKHVVSLPCGHDSLAVREWLDGNHIPFLYSTHNIPHTVEYRMTTEEDAILFRMRWG